MQQESKPEAIADLEREVLTMKIEFEALRKETDAASIARLAQLKAQLASRQAEVERRASAWGQERAALEKRKSARARLAEARAELAIAERDGNLGRAGELTHAVLPRLEKELAQWEGATTADGESHVGGGLLGEQVTAHHIAEVVSRATGIPTDRLVAGEKHKLMQMEAALSKQVVGQPHALQVVSDAVRVARAGLQPAERPMGVFLFVGPTGVGKTQLCKALAQQLFDSEEAVTRLDMSEFSEQHSVSRLVGAPPGYVGYDEGGQLTEAVRRRPYAIVLFDEFEKAHRDVSTLLLQVMDEGQLTDSHGKRVDFRNTLLVLTSNLGAAQLAALPEGAPAEDARPQVNAEIAKAFAPEFVNRIDQIVLFNRLQRAQIAQIAALEVSKVGARLAEQGLHLRASRQAIGWIAEAGYEPAYGARPVRRAVRQHLLNPLARQLIHGQVGTDGATVLIGAQPSAAALTIRIMPKDSADAASEDEWWDTPDESAQGGAGGKTTSEPASKPTISSWFD
mmetsp:Transcript_13663/g.32655  ORF Transcript_13663/g.32655 Transcript_13663/m.32655 type:complete len:510 (-) Transcript_13663:306-1835(-)